MNIHDWKARRESLLLGQVLRFLKSMDQNKVVTKALDGTYYIQTVGQPAQNAAITLLCDASEKERFDHAEADGALITVEYRDVRYYGYIMDKPSWQIVDPATWFGVEFKLLIVEEEKL